MAATESLLILDASNLYAAGTMLTFENGDQSLFQKDLVIVPDKKDEYYTVRYKDTLDAIAAKFYGPKIINASRYWWVIAKANNIGIDSPPLDLSEFVGVSILIPDIYRIKLLLQ